MFRFAYPEYLWLLWLLPLLVAVWTAAGQLARRRLSRFGRLETIRPLMPDASTGRRRLKFILYLTAFALLTLALARPQLGSKLREVESRGIEMMLVVDVSNSMLAEDFQPNRLERTKYAIDKLFDGLKQDRVGLVVFAGDAVVQLPITSDYRMAKAFARRISPSMVSVQGTDIGQALSLATMSFSEKGDNPAGRVIVLITDGEGHDSGASKRPNGPPNRASASSPSASARRKALRSRSAASSSRTTRERWSYRTGRTPARKDRTGDRRSLHPLDQPVDRAGRIVRTINNMEKATWRPPLRGVQRTVPIPDRSGPRPALAGVPAARPPQPAAPAFQHFRYGHRKIKNSDSPLTPNRRAFCRFRRLGVRETTGRITPRSDGSALSPND